MLAGEALRLLNRSSRRVKVGVYLYLVRILESSNHLYLHQ